MKKIFPLISVLILAAACAAPPANREAAGPANANLASTPAMPAMTEAAAIANEKAIWDTIKNKDYVAFGNMLAEDQLEVMGEAVHDKAGSLASIKDFEPSEVNFSDWKFLSIDKDAYLVNYTADTKGKYKGKEFPPESARCSSVWVTRGGKWLAIYHQECPVRKPMTPPATAKATPSPATTAPAPATASTGPDPIANEKMVWDFFKTKSYDAFADALAPDFVEVEPDGVYDKAGTVKGIQQMNMIKAELSDFQTVRLDDDASLVVYVAKMPGFAPNGERHATIWSNRNGKWLAIFHHGGTPVVNPAAIPPTKASPSLSPSPRVTASPAAKTP